MACSKCELLLTEKAKYCSNCGTPTSSTPSLKLRLEISKSSLPWIIAIVASFVTISVIIGLFLWMGIRDANNNAAMALDANERIFALFEQRLKSIERNLDLIVTPASIDTPPFADPEIQTPGHGICGIQQLPPSSLPRQPEIELRPLIPPGGFLDHFITPGQSLASIAQIYWPHNPYPPSGRILNDELVAHLANTNNLSNPEELEVGTWLRIYEHPFIEQPFDWRHP